VDGKNLADLPTARGWRRLGKLLRHGEAANSKSVGGFLVGRVSLEVLGDKDVEVVF
jgi:hypothetical protein